MYDVISKIKVRKNVQYISILISNHSGNDVKLSRNITSGHVSIMNSLEAINLTLTKCIKKGINPREEDNPTKSLRKSYMDPSLDENTKKAFS